MTDSLHELIDDLRKHRPKVYDADRFAMWGEGMAQAIQALPHFEQRWASVALIANDVAVEMAMPMAMAFRSLASMLLTHADVQQLNSIPQSMEGRR